MGYKETKNAEWEKDNTLTCENDGTQLEEASEAELAVWETVGAQKVN